MKNRVPSQATTNGFLKCAVRVSDDGDNVLVSNSGSTAGNKFQIINKTQWACFSAIGPITRAIGTLLVSVKLVSDTTIDFSNAAFGLSYTSM